MLRDCGVTRAKMFMLFFHNIILPTYPTLRLSTQQGRHDVIYPFQNLLNIPHGQVIMKFSAFLKLLDFPILAVPRYNEANDFFLPDHLLSSTLQGFLT